jgi:hypothetical protein
MYNLVFTPGNDFEGHEYQDYLSLPNTAQYYATNLVTNSVYMADNGLKVKPPTWTGRRPAQGDLQLALGDFVQTWYALDGKIADYNQTLAELETEIGHRMADYDRYPTEWQQHEINEDNKKATANIIEGLKVTKEMANLVAESIKSAGESSAEIIPDLEAGVTGFLPTFSTSTKVSAPVIAAFEIAYYASLISSESLEAGIAGREGQQENWDADLEKLLKGDEYQALLQWNTADTLVKLKEQYVKQAELLAQFQALSQSYERVQKLVAEGQRLIFERGQVRSRAAQRIQSQRYADLNFRIFRDDALRRYQTAFDLAAR